MSQPASQPSEPSRKRTLPQSSAVGHAANIRRRVMPSYPPGVFRHAMPQRVGVQRRKPRYQRSRFGRRKYPRPGSRVMAMRPSRGSVVPSEVRRKYAETDTLKTWTKKNAGSQTPSAAALMVPFTFQDWQRGTSDNRFTGSRVTLKNISLMMQLQFPKTIPTAQNVPYRI
eukprot:SAG11_NODE_5551_length_1527_cov_2.154062_2_plen_170_part_00